MDEQLKIMCPKLSCKKVLSVPVHARGKVVRCGGCSSLIRIPDLGEVRVSDGDAPEVVGESSKPKAA